MKKDNSKSNEILDFKVLRRLMAFVVPYKIRFYLLIFLTIALAVVAPLRPILIQRAIDNDVAAGDYNGLVQMILLLVAVLLLQALIQYFHTYSSGWLGQQIIKDMRVKLYAHVLRMKLKFYDNTPIGQLVTRTISDIETLAEVFSQGLAAMIGDSLQLVLILTVMFYEDWRLALVSLSMLPFLLVSTYVFKEKIKHAFNEVRNAVSNLNTFVQEHVTGMSIVQIFGSEATELEKFKEINKTHKRANIKTVKYYSIYFPVAEILGAAGVGLLVWFGAKGVVNFEETGITIGKLIAFIMYINMFFRPIRMIADRFNTLQLGLVSTARILKLLDDDTYISDEGEQKMEEVKGAVEFKNVWFAYNERDYVLKGINFKVESGQTLALVGATGAGKSSVINLLNRFYDINRGDITIDGVDIQSIQLQVLRQNIGIVLQDVFLFSDSIRKNITLGNTNITDEQILEAAQLVGADVFINKLPGRLDYNVMERGATLSVGQRQLISFVRAMVYNPKILILDEATSSVDSETEELIQNAIAKMMTGRTSIVIAHRLSTIQNAHNIVVMDQGEIKEQGSHAALLKKEGFYNNLHQMQLID